MGAEKTWCGGVDCVTGAEDVCQCTEPYPAGEGYSEGRCSTRLGTQPAALHLKPCQASFALESLWRTSMPMPLLSLLNHWRNLSGGS